jgi:malonate decarboxylase gamma subunit
MSESASGASRGRTWFHAVAAEQEHVPTGLGSVLVADAKLAGERARLLAVVPDSKNRFPRAREGEVGLEEGWSIAQHVRDAIAADRAGATRRPIVAIVDVKSQAYGRLEERLGIHCACAAAADAYAAARMAGHPVVGLIVGQAMSGAFLAHGYQCHRLLALDDAGIAVHAMGRQAAARVTRRSVEELEALGRTIIPMSYEIRQFARLGLLHELIPGIDPDSPSPLEVEHVRDRVAAAIADIRNKPGDLINRLDNPQARATRAASIEVRRKMAEQWDATNGLIQE